MRAVKSMACLQGFVLMFAAGLAPAQERKAGAKGAENTAFGRWNITVENKNEEGETWTHPSWLVIELEGGKPVGRFLAAHASVYPIGEVKIDGNKVVFKADHHTWTGTVKGDVMTGTRVHESDKEGKHKGKWTARRSVPKVDVTGTWYLHRQGVPIEYPAVLELEQDGNNVTGTFTEDGKRADIRNGRVTRGMFLSFRVMRDGHEQIFSAGIRGDVLDNGRASSGGGGSTYVFQAYRERSWGDPIEVFNGKDLSNWEPFGFVDKNKWTVIDGIMTNPPGGKANIKTKGKYRNFKLHVEFRVPKGGNSGVYLRGRHEIQIADSAGGPPSWHGCGSLYSRLAPAVNAARPHGEWQTYDVRLVENFVTVVHNGEVIHDNAEMEGITGGALDSHESEPGPIYLQGDHTAIEYRKITLWPMK